MNILFFTNIITPYRIGLYNKLNEFFNGNIKFYFDRKIELNRKWQIDEEKLYFKYEIKNTFFYKKISKATNSSKLYRFIYFPFYIFPVVFKVKPDVILANEFGFRTLFALISGKLVNSKIIVLSEVTGQSEKYIKFTKLKFRKILTKYLDGGIAHGKKSYEYLISLGFQENQVIISPDSIDNSFFEKSANSISKSSARGKIGLPGNKFIFLYVGQFVQRKGLDLLLSSIKRLCNEVDTTNIEFIFVGGKDSYLKKNESKGLTSLIKVFEFKEGDDLSLFYKAADCFIFPTRNDVWGMVVNEAVASGLPVAVSKYAGCADDLIENNISGIVFDPLDKDTFVDTLKFCLENPSQLSEFADKAKENLGVFNHSIAAKRIVNFISKF